MQVVLVWFGKRSIFEGSTKQLAISWPMFAFINTELQTSLAYLCCKFRECGATRGRDAKASLGAVPTWVSERCLWCHSARSLGWDVQKQGERIASGSSTGVQQLCIDMWHLVSRLFIPYNFMHHRPLMPIPPLIFPASQHRLIRWWATAMAWSPKDSNMAMSASVWSMAQSRWIHLRWLPVRPSPKKLLKLGMDHFPDANLG